MPHELSSPDFPALFYYNVIIVQSFIKHKTSPRSKMQFHRVNKASPSKGFDSRKGFVFAECANILTCADLAS